MSWQEPHEAQARTAPADLAFRNETTTGTGSPADPAAGTLAAYRQNLPDEITPRRMTTPAQRRRHVTARRFGNAETRLPLLAG